MRRRSREISLCANGSWTPWWPGSRQNVRRGQQIVGNCNQITVIVVNSLRLRLKYRRRYEHAWNWLLKGVKIIHVAKVHRLGRKVHLLLRERYSGLSMKSYGISSHTQSQKKNVWTDLEGTEQKGSLNQRYKVTSRIGMAQTVPHAWPRSESHQCLLKNAQVCGSMLALKRLAGVAPQVTRRNPLRAG